MSGYPLTDAARDAGDAIERARSTVTKLWCEIARDHHDNARGPSTEHENTILLDGLSQALKAHAKTLAQLREVYFSRELAAQRRCRESSPVGSVVGAARAL